MRKKTKKRESPSVGGVQDTIQKQPTRFVEILSRTLRIPPAYLQIKELWEFHGFHRHRH